MRCAVLLLGLAAAAAAAADTAPKPVLLRHRLLDFAYVPVTPTGGGGGGDDDAPDGAFGLYWVQVDPARLHTDRAVRHATGCDSVPHRLHGHTIQCLLTAAEAAAAAGRDGVVHVGAVQPDEKYDHAALHRSSEHGAQALLLPSDRVDARAVAAALQGALGGLYHVRRVGRYALAVLDAAEHAPTHARAHPQGRPAARHGAPPPAVLAALAARPEVYWVQPWARVRVGAAFSVPFLLNTTAGSAAAVAAMAAPAAPGELIAIGDTGCDLGHCAFGPQHTVAQTLLTLTHGETPPAPTLGPGKVRGYVSYVFAGDGGGGEPVGTDWTDFVSGHGTHVMSLAAGLHPSGAARDAELLVLDFGFSEGGEQYLWVPYDFHDHVLGWLSTHTAARVFSASWGTEDNTYTEQARQIDEHAWANDDFVVVVAAGNGGTAGIGTVGSPATAKNILSVGATYAPAAAFGHYALDPSRWVENGGRYPFASPAPGLGPDAVAAFSARGPTADGRIKPDLLVPGGPIAGARAHYGCETSVRQGTSMAAPLVAGLVARLRTAWGDPSSALVRAGLITWAHPPTRVVALDITSGGLFAPRTLARVPTERDYGFGVVRFGDPAALAVLADRQPLAEGAALAWGADFAAPPGNVTITLAWTDPPAAPHARLALVHNLDLDVVVDGARRVFGNHRAVPDYLNNVERVRVAPTASLVVTVRGVTVAPGVTQPFALVVSSDVGLSARPPAGSTCDPALPAEVAGEPCVLPHGGGWRRCGADGVLEDVCTPSYCVGYYVWDDGHGCVPTETLACGASCSPAHGLGRWCTTTDGIEQCLLSSCYAGFWRVNGTCTCVHDIECSDGSTRRCAAGVLGACGSGRPARRHRRDGGAAGGGGGLSTRGLLAGIALLLLVCGVAEVVQLSPRPVDPHEPARVVEPPAAKPPPPSPPLPPSGASAAYALRPSGAAGGGTSAIVRFFDEPARSYSPLRVRHSTQQPRGMRTGLLQMPPYE
jgi:hypothetical protein